MSKPSEPQAKGITTPRIITADTARRCRLWNRGRLMLEDPFGTYRIAKVDQNMRARSIPVDPEIEPQSFQLIPARTLLFIPDSRGLKRNSRSDE